MNLGPLEIGLIILAILLLFGYKKLPDASRSLGRSLRIFKGEMKGMKDDDAGSAVRGKEAARAGTPVRGEISAPVTPAPTAAASSASGDLTAQLQEEARAAELRARAEQSRAADGPR
ncbi:Sec-independent protein translocase subunit TatA [Blastococcus deserti]|uniref:Sec-independent protein translocase protein TatA n=1 Tax=Blastococcus deserti TaxID=2259033 RepID=A0ABW4XE82_9ACTN